MKIGADPNFCIFTMLENVGNSEQKIGALSYRASVLTFYNLVLLS